MNKQHIPFFTFFLCAVTLCVSMLVALQITGTLLGKSRIIYLADYGGITWQSLKSMELWRFFTAQLIHVHQKHMLYNVLSILILGIILERQVGYKYMLSIWLVAGGFGTAFTTAFGSVPWNTGTGASQAALAYAGFSVIFLMTHRKTKYDLLGAALFAILPALYLDLKTAGYPKPAHALSFMLGAIIAWYYQCRVKLHSPVLGS
ncbi:rhomboid family intramembrane serine protease [Pseudoalteromonas sp. SMS1]|uniref:rhomboid family intramembrane serine protease n=1 Tax=Pseudoalteromonas sp. SMS1 TaxID=2908894 RepID=UPI001F3E56D7|nr:rhomboid family intramembrane serine protease [Pseudoalteromonas sp. SMS1]MCF2859168.1 rhomboid family intramembrane serine protease [Pseudoalteromonas sp. SMS1]